MPANNPLIFNAAVIGFMRGAFDERDVRGVTAAEANTAAQGAVAFGVEVDSLILPDPALTDEDGLAMEACCFDAISGRYSHNMSPASYAALAQAAVTLWDSTEAQLLPVIGPPPSSGYALRVVAFAYNSVSPINLLNVGSGAIVNYISVVVNTAFDDPTASLEVGSTLLGPDEFMTVEPVAKAQYNSTEVSSYPITDNLLLTLLPAGSTVGNGFVVIGYQT